MSSTSASPQPLLARATAWALRRTLVRAFLRYSERRGAQLADSVTYRALFSIFAAVLLGFSLAAMWLAGNPAALSSLADAVNSAVPGLVGTDGDGLIDLSEIDAPAGLTIAGVISLVGLVGASIGAIGSLRMAVRTIADTSGEDVFFLWVLLRNLGLAVAIALLLVLSAAATFVGSLSVTTVLSWLGVAEDSTAAQLGTRTVGVLVVFVLDALVVLLMFWTMSGVKAPRRALLSGAAVGGAGLTVLQELSGLFVGGASSNPLLASFASIVALLLWVNLSAQVMLISASVIVTITREADDRMRERFGASTFAERRRQRAEDAVRIAADELQRAQAAVQAEQDKVLEKAQRA
ncbi:membrane protein [Microbacterium sp. SORGH_AS428]|uniref:YihY/virulence factor BrkB family protein n=1 Tax=Microbacterium sp. SORGH_AS_0428 TaxID=3041788 RepID=UPI002857CE1A|nr:YihY/virulence factor BrkB family protein [Microbacterium sp. SORGH_AS_0428]MDR6198713.1 membrane protein [Microbacterium sp. SORGH_AS_0428]